MKKTSILAFLMIALGFMAKAQDVTYTPNPVVDSSENVVVTWHPYVDTNVSDSNTVKFAKASSSNLIYVYTWVYSQGVTYQYAQWGDVPDSTPLLTTRVDSNDYNFTITNLHNFYSIGEQPLPAEHNIDSIAVIFRTASGDSQTINNYIFPIQLTVAASEAVTNVNAGNTKVSLYPNPANSNLQVNYSFAEKANTTITVSNLLGQTVITQELGQKQSGSVNLSVNNIPTGVYMVTVTNGSNKVVQRMIKE